MAGIKFDDQRVGSIIDSLEAKNEAMNKLISDAFSCTNKMTWEGDARDAFYDCFLDLRSNCDTGYFIIKNYISHLKFSKLAYETNEMVLKTVNESFE